MAEKENTEKQSFLVQVQFQQYATWQGTVQWLEGESTKRFRSTLEMIRLLDSALSSAARGNGTAQWEDDTTPEGGTAL